ncbi:Cyanovirin-N [Aspergillus tamarii]|uniref:Cyanovirin-N n=1 Tax=Aspergillus tamarii TaxID=41984 RepID=A0A5N6UZG3_ASPTM|nr:Cyanovirin-N [Aspergillus tamarii]
MSFHESAEEVNIRDGHILFARLRNEEGEFQDSEINLNEFLGNNNGSFEWEGENFAESAEDISFAIEGDGEVPVLRALLLNGDGEPVEDDINLSERVFNRNGEFVFE